MGRAPTTGHVEVRVLGPLRIVRAGRSVELSGQRRQSLLVALALHAGQALSVPRLVEMLWGRRPPATARQSLANHIAHVRRVIEPGRDRSTGFRILRTRASSYLFDIAGEDVDVIHFEVLVRDALRHRDRGDLVRAAMTLRTARSLWRGDRVARSESLHGLEGRLTHLQELRLTAQEALVAVEMARGRHRRVLPDLRSLVDRHPLRESLWEKLIITLERVGARSEAIAAYQEVETVLAEELDVEPSGRLQELRRAVVEGHTVTAVPPTTGPGRMRTSALPVLVAPSLLGRGSELVDIRGALVSHPVVTLTGPPGVGKTTLAAYVAGRLPGEAHVHFSRLGPLETRCTVASELCRELGLQQPPGTDPVAAVAEGLQSADLLLVLDGCEHLRGQVAVIAAAITATCPDVRVLVTSRHPLRIPQERVVPIEPLETPEPDEDDLETLQANAAVALFLERAAAASPGLDVDERNAPLIAEICSRLDGLPLALELAAALTRAIALHDILDRLEDRFALLGPSGQGRHSGERSLTAAVERSYRLLDPAERKLFDRLSVFQGDVPLTAIERVCADDALEPRDISRLLAGLVNASMVNALPRGEAQHYRTLETLRIFGSERLTERGTHETVERRHAEYFTDLAKTADRGLASPDERTWHERLIAALPDIRHAWSWATANDDLDVALALLDAVHWWAYWRMAYDVFNWGRAVSPQARRAEHPLAPVALACAAAEALVLGQLTSASELAEEAIARAPDPGSPGLPMAHHVAGAVAFFQGRPDDFADQNDRAIAAAERADRGYVAVHLETGRPYAAALAGDTEHGVATLESQLDRANRGGNPTRMAWTHFCLGHALVNTAIPRAIDHLQNALRLARPVANRHIERLATPPLHSLLSAETSLDDVLHRFRSAIERGQDATDHVHLWITYRFLIQALVEHGRMEAAHRLLHATLNLPASAMWQDEQHFRTMHQTMHDQNEFAAEPGANSREDAHAHISKILDETIEQLQATG